MSKYATLCIINIVFIAYILICLYLSDDTIWDNKFPLLALFLSLLNIYLGFKKSKKSN